MDEIERTHKGEVVYPVSLITDSSLPVKTACLWTDLAGGTVGMYNTGCGNAFEFDCGGVEANEAKFCLFCGKPIVVTEAI